MACLSVHYRNLFIQDDVTKHFPGYWPYVRGIHWPPVDSHHKCQWRGALMFSLMCAWTNGLANNRNAGLRRHGTHYDATVKMGSVFCTWIRACINNSIRSLMLDVIAHSCHDFTGGIVKPPLKIGLGEQCRIASKQVNAGVIPVAGSLRIRCGIRWKHNTYNWVVVR